MMLDEQNGKSWRDIILSFLHMKYENELNGFLDEQFKSLKKEYEKNNYFNNDKIEFVFNARLNKPAEEQSKSDFIIEQIKYIKDFSGNLSAIAILENINVKNNQLRDKYSAIQWLSKSAQNSKHIYFGTHVPKLTHSAIKTNPIVDKIQSNKNDYITTSCLEAVTYDSGASNAFSQIREFFSLELNGVKLYEIFEDQDNEVLRSFTSDKTQLKEWNEGFIKALTIGDLELDPLLKQVYFPVSEAESGYHLLAQIDSSSMSMELFDRIGKSRIEKKALKFNKERVSFPKVAQTFVTSGNDAFSHGNVSKLNKDRWGAKYLFSGQAPVWKSQIKPPIYRNSFFFELSRNYQVRETIQYLADFLVRFESLALSIKDPKRFNWIKQWLEDLTDEVIVYVKTIQALPAGWSIIDDICLKQEQQVLLDCHRNDEAFRELQRHNWQAVIVEDFANWLNYSLRKANEKCTPQELHKKLWAKLFEENIRELFALEKFELQEVNA